MPTDRVLTLGKIDRLIAILRSETPTLADARNVYRAIGQELDPPSARLAARLKETEDLREGAVDAAQFGPAAQFQRLAVQLSKELEDEAARRAAEDRPVSQMSRVEFLENQLSTLQKQAAAYEGRDGQAWARMSSQILAVRDALDKAREGVTVEETDEQVEAGIIADLCTMGEAQVARIVRQVLDHRPDLWRKIGSPSERRLVQ